MEGLNLKRGMTVVDATLGSGGHSEKILEKIGKKGRLVAFDVDRLAIESVREKWRIKRVDFEGRVFFADNNFSNLKEELEKWEIGKVDAILADLGWRMEQVEDEKYGMSFLRDSRLDMRFDQDDEKTKTAYEIVNNWEEKELKELFFRKGEEKNSAKIARKIVEKRKKEIIETTGQLAQLIEEICPRRGKKIHPATKVFQALRIEVNRELENLESFLEQSVEALKREGRLAIISFHSLEDWMVKDFFRTNARGCVCPREFPVCRCGKKAALKIISKKPIISMAEELAINPSARSARLRIAEKI